MSLYIFDQGNTLIKTPRTPLGLSRPPTRPEEQILLPGVFERLEGLRALGHKIAIASNQDAVAWGTITYQQAAELLENCVQKIGGADSWTFSPYNPAARLVILRGHKPNPYARDHPSRKPHPGMIHELMGKLDFTPGNTILVGDSKTDEKTARAANISFIPAKEFFKFEAK